MMVFASWNNSYWCKVILEPLKWLISILLISSFLVTLTRQNLRWRIIIMPYYPWTTILLILRYYSITCQFLWVYPLVGQRQKYDDTKEINQLNIIGNIPIQECLNLMIKIFTAYPKSWTWNTNSFIAYYQEIWLFIESCFRPYLTNWLNIWTIRRKKKMEVEKSTKRRKWPHNAFQVLK